MAGTRAAIRYAKAILDIAQVNNSTQAVNSDITSIVNAIKDSAELKDFLQSPIVKGEIKFSSLNEIFASAQIETKFSIWVHQSISDPVGCICMQSSNYSFLLVANA